LEPAVFVKEQFKMLLEGYRKQGFEGKYQALYQVFYQLQLVAQAFQILKGMKMSLQRS